jgi:hypothetical protein
VQAVEYAAGVFGSFDEARDVQYKYPLILLTNTITLLFRRFSAGLQTVPSKSKPG